MQPLIFFIIYGKIIIFNLLKDKEVLYYGKVSRKEIAQAYKNAKLNFFDNSSKYIFFSDCHRGDATPSDEFANQNIYLFALEYYFRNGFTHVELEMVMSFGNTLILSILDWPTMRYMHY